MITNTDLNQCHMRERAHYNGGDKFFAYLYEVVEHPRLTRYDHYDKKAKGVTSTWRVDGADMAGFDEAIAALNLPPAFSPKELTALALVTDEPADLRKHEMWRYFHGSLNDKAAVHWEAGRCRLTDLGRAALADN